MSRPNRRRRDEETCGVVGLPVLEHGVQRMKQLDGDNDQRLLGRFALSLLAEINGAPLGTTAHGIDGGEVERMARNARADGRQAGRRRAVAALVDDRVKADIRDERPSIGEACERAEFAEQGGGRLRADADRKSTRLNSSHLVISYAVFCLKKKKKPRREGDDNECRSRV